MNRSVFRPLTVRCFKQSALCESTVRVRLMEKGGHFAYRFPFIKSSWQKAQCQLQSCIFSMLKKLYLLPFLFLEIKAGLKAFIVCPYSRLRNKFCGVLDSKKNLKCFFDRHKRISVTAPKQMLPISLCFWLINRFNCISFSKYWGGRNQTFKESLLCWITIPLLHYLSLLRLLSKILALKGFNFFLF